MSKGYIGQFPAGTPIDIPVPTGVGRNIMARTNAATPTSQIDIDADELIVRDGTRTSLLTSVNLTVAITSAGANGLDTGSEAASTWYYGWVIYNPATDTVAGLISVSSTAPTMPSGYTHKALVTAVRNDGSSNFIAYRQAGFWVQPVTSWQVLTAGVSGTIVSVALGGFVPPIHRVVQFRGSQVTPASAGQSEGTVYSDSGGSFPVAQVIGFSTGAVQSSSGAFSIFPGVAQTVYYQVSSGSLHLWVTGYGLPGGGE